MSPAQLRQHAANRFMSANKQEWSDRAVVMLRDAADWMAKHELADFMPTEHYYKAVREANPLLKPCQDLITYLDKHPPMGESIYAVRQIREAVAATVVPAVQHVPADDTEGGAL